MASSAYSYLLSDPDDILNLKPHPDNFLIDEKTGYDIDRVRELTWWMYRKPFSRSYKIALIKRAEGLSVEAQNTLLKSAEEPPQNNFLFFAVQNPDKLIVTLKSRCENITLDQLKRKELSHSPEVTDWLQSFEWASKPERLSTSYPQIEGLNDAFGAAKKLTKMTRPKLLDYLDDWGKYLILEDPQKNYLIVNEILKAKEYLSHNTNIQLTLEVTFLKIAKLIDIEHRLATGKLEC